MKIVHLCLACFFPDGYSYQENMLPKFHKRLGYEVEVIASLVTFDEDGKGTFLKKGSKYLNEYGIPVTRLDYKRPSFFYKKFKRYKGLYKELERAKPDILFIHGCQFRDMDVVVKYLTHHKEVKVYVDNHADFSNSATNIISKYFLHKFLWKHSAKIIEVYTSKFYGVLPARVDFLKDIYGVSEDKVSLLVMGADDDKVEEAIDGDSRSLIRNKYGIGRDDFLIMTGGKIDEWKTQTLMLMEAVHKINSSKIKLIVFGSVVPQLKDRINRLADNNKVKYIGWIDSEQSYNYWAAADLAVFPGRHSVFWEQVAGMGIPMLCKYWDGTTHIDMGGNVLFLYKDSVDEIKQVLEGIINQPLKYTHMKEVAQNKARVNFSYKEISQKAIGEIDSD